MGRARCLLALMNLVSFFLIRGQRTVIAAAGIRIKRGLRWRRLSWDDVQSVKAPCRWNLEGTVKVRTTMGEEVLLDVPGELHEQLAAYAEVHRAAGPLSGADESDAVLPPE